MRPRRWWVLLVLMLLAGVGLWADPVRAGQPSPPTKTPLVPTKTPVEPAATATPVPPAPPTKTSMPTDTSSPTEVPAPPTPVHTEPVHPTAKPDTPVPPTLADPTLTLAPAPPTTLPLKAATPRPSPRATAGGGRITVLPTVIATGTPKVRPSVIPSPTPGRGSAAGVVPVGPVAIAGGAIVLGGITGLVLLRRRRRGRRPGVAPSIPQVDRHVRVRPEQVARLVGAFRSVYTVSPEVLRALERALPAVDQPLRRLLKGEIDAYFAGERTRLFAGLPEDMDPGGYLQQFVAVVTTPGATKEGLLEALAQLEERLMRR